MKIDLLVKFSVTKEIDQKSILVGISHLLVEEEKVELAFTHVRDKIWFTNKRLIVWMFKA